MTKLIPLLVSFLFFAFNANAQLQKILHQSFEIEEVNAISLDIHGEYEIEKWAGNTILTETHIQLYDASPSVLRFFVEQGRYDIKGELSGETNFSMVSKDKIRKTMKVGENECYEFIKVRILVPEDFTVSNKKSLVRVSDELEEPVTAKENDN